MSNNMSNNMQNMQKCWEGLLQSYRSYFAYICTPDFAKSQSVPSMMKLASNCDEDLNNSERTARYCRKFEIDPNQLPKPTRFVKKQVDIDRGAWTKQRSESLLPGAGSAPDLLRRNASI